MKFLDLFAGIGGFRLGMEMAGHECVGYVEIDKFARKSYQAMHDTEGEWTASDITRVTDDDVRELGDRGYIDIICGGFPCQAFSVAGKRGGFKDTRGTLFFEIARFARILRPHYLFLENVTGLLNHENGDTFETIIRTLDEIGYDAEWDCLNSKNFGVPQNRDRVFIIGHIRGSSTRKVFPVGTSGKKTNDGYITTGTLTARYPASQREGTYIEEVRERKGACGVGIKEATKQGYDVALPGDSVNYSVPNSETRRGRVGRSLANTLDTQCNQATLTRDLRLRKLTPRECFRLQGFPDWSFDKAKEVNSDSQLYKQAGNSVTVNVIYEIAKRLVIE